MAPTLRLGHNLHQVSSIFAVTLSRVSLSCTTESTNYDGHVLRVDLRSEVEIGYESVDMVRSCLVSDTTLQLVRHGMHPDLVITTLTSLIHHCWPDTRAATPSEVRDYFNYRDELTVQDNIAS